MPRLFAASGAAGDRVEDVSRPGDQALVRLLPFFVCLGALFLSKRNKLSLSHAFALSLLTLFSAILRASVLLDLPSRDALMRFASTLQLRFSRMQCVQRL